ncbi:MAG: hypothetical protein EP332_10305 [Bacteroidetes bacterium]|nr:MAG: hypothetical protein EP332_10305 [Bacteroidota bacterium]
MKTTNLFPALAMGLLIGLAACQKDTETTPEIAPEVSSSTELDDLENVIPFEFDYMDIYAEDADMILENDGIPMLFEDGGFDYDANAQLKGNGPCDRLNLSDTQKRQLRRAWEDQIDCRQASMNKLRDLHRALLRKAHVARMEAVQAFRNGRITEQQLQRKMQEIRNHLRAAMRDQGQQHRLAMARCYRQYAEKVKRILGQDDFRAWMRCRHMLLRHR